MTALIILAIVGTFAIFAMIVTIFMKFLDAAIPPMHIDFDEDE